MISGHLGRSQIDCVEKQTKCSIGSEDISLFVEIIADLHQKKRFTGLWSDTLSFQQLFSAFFMQRKNVFNFDNRHCGMTLRNGIVIVDYFRNLFPQTRRQCIWKFKTDFNDRLNDLKILLFVVKRCSDRLVSSFFRTLKSLYDATRNRNPNIIQIYDTNSKTNN